MGKHPHTTNGDTAAVFRANLDHLRGEHGMTLDEIAAAVKIERFIEGADRGRRAEVLKDLYRGHPSAPVHQAVAKLRAKRDRSWVPWSEMERRVLEHVRTHPGTGLTDVAHEVRGTEHRLRETVTRLVERGEVRAEGRWPPVRGAKTRLYAAEPGAGPAAADDGEPVPPQPPQAARENGRARPEAVVGSGALGGSSPAEGTAATGEERRAETQTSPRPEGELSADPLEAACRSLWEAVEHLTASASNPPPGLRPYLREEHRRSMTRMADAVTDILTQLER